MERVVKVSDKVLQTCKWMRSSGPHAAVRVSSKLTAINVDWNHLLVKQCNMVRE
jgi:hypothetical protein